MLYLIGGASRSGKTLVAQRLLEMDQVPRFSVDYFTSALQRGNPNLGIHHDDPRAERSEKLWRYLKPLLSNLLHEEPSYTVEGEALSPRLVREFVDENPERARACFLGFPDADIEAKLATTRSFTGKINNWITGVTPEELRSCIVNGIKDSREIASECSLFELQYINTAHDFLTNVELARDFLINGSKAVR